MDLQPYHDTFSTGNIVSSGITFVGFFFFPRKIKKKIPVEKEKRMNFGCIKSLRSAKFLIQR